MSKVHEAGLHVARLSKTHEVDPFAVVGLLALHALVAVDFPLLRLWRDVSEDLRGMATA